MSIPVRPEPDPFSLALGRIEGRLEGLEKRLERVEEQMATKAELRVWGSLLVLMVGALLAIVVQHGAH